MSRSVRGLALVALVLAGVSCTDRRAASSRTLVFAAASLQEVVGELAREFERREAATVELNLAGSNTLAQQILAAPGADVFLSADRHWVEVLERAGRVVAGSRRPLLGNRLVLVARDEAEPGIDRVEELPRGEFDLLAMADPEAVPAGLYARAALEQLPHGDSTMWQAVAHRIAPALDVRAALALVESDPRILGIVYRTDARRSARVRVLDELPDEGAARVTYHGALLEDGGAPRLGRRFLEFVAGPEGRRIAEQHGFGAPQE